MAAGGRASSWSLCLPLPTNGTRKSWLLTKTGLTVLLIPIAVLYFLAFRLNFKIDHVPFFRRAMGAGEPALNGTTKTILFWTSMFSDKNFYFGEEDIFDGCPVSDCYATHERNFASVDQFDALLFHGNELKRQDLPASRNPSQWYVYVNLESPANGPLEDGFYLEYFNLSMTYRLNSDVLRTYAVVREKRSDRMVAPSENVTWTDFLPTASGRVTRNQTMEAAGAEEQAEEEASLVNSMKSKSKPIAWFVSNCRAKSGRTKYVEELSRYLEVDVYGACGDHRCPRTRDCFRDIVEPDYFFYLSFENSLCVDYVTEKLYNPLRYNVVPVVYGGANYSRFAPPGSYVDALDFDTPEDLAAYLKRLMTDPDRYRRYFRWKKFYRIEDGSKRAICELCDFLHRGHPPRTRPESLREWYNRDHCPYQRILASERYLTKLGLSTLNRSSDQP